jgi:hypothetical protein
MVETSTTSYRMEVPQMRRQKILVTVLAIGCLVSLSWLGASLFSGSKAIAGDTAGQRWEYMIVQFDQVWSHALLGPFNKAAGMPFIAEAPNAQSALDAAGGAGWELVTVVGVLNGAQEFIFKRPAP